MDTPFDDTSYALEPLSRRTFLKGAMIGSAALVAGGVAVGTAPPAFAADQSDWRWCRKCQGLWYQGGNGTGRCPAGGGHSRQGSGNYTVQFDVNFEQKNWRWCRKCQGMWFGGSREQGRCPAGGGHSRQGSGNYSLRLA